MDESDLPREQKISSDPPVDGAAAPLSHEENSTTDMPPASHPQQKKEAAKILIPDMPPTDRFNTPMSPIGVTDKKAARKFWIKMAFLFLLIGISIVLLFTITDSLTEDSITSLPALIAGINLEWLFILIGVVILCIVFDSARYAYILKISTGKFHFRASMKVMFLGKYYDGITPLGTGGQPFQIHYLHKKNSIPAGVATAVPLVLFTVHTVVFCTLAAVLFCLAPGYTADGNQTITTTFTAIAWVSMICNLLVPVVIITVSLFPRFGKRGVMWVVKVLSKLRLVKHPLPVGKKYVREATAYRASLTNILKRWWHFIPLAILSFGSAVLSMGVPFFVMMALADFTPSFEIFVQILCMSMLTSYSASLVPTPGNSGALVTAASLIFATVLGASAGGTIGWSILLWRLLTYYLYIVIGVGITIFEMIRATVRRKRAERAA